MPVSDQCWCPCRINVQWCPVQLVSMSDQCWCPFRISAGARVGSVLVPVSDQCSVVSRATSVHVGSMLVVPVPDQCWCLCRINAGARAGSMLVFRTTSVHVGSVLVPVSDQCRCPSSVSGGEQFQGCRPRGVSPRRFFIRLECVGFVPQKPLLSLSLSLLSLIHI